MTCLCEQLNLQCRMIYCNRLYRYICTIVNCTLHIKKEAVAVYNPF